MSSIYDLGQGIYQVDIYEQGESDRTACYLITAQKTALIETGAAPGAGSVMAAIKSLGICPEEVEYIIVTHIHLDHAGGAGLMARNLPKAGVVVHPRGARHLIDPSRLVAGARMVYKERFDDYFGEVLPVPKERVQTPGDGETLDLGGGRVLTFYHTPGHARHHLVIHDPASRGIFSGDALGIRFQALSKLVGYNFTLPSTSPSEFDPQAAVDTLNRMNALDLKNIYFTHFGKAGDAPSILARNKELVRTFEAIGRDVLASGGGSKQIEEALWELVMRELEQHGVLDREHPAVKFLALDMELNAKGLVHYFEKMKG